ncbi:MAG: hypothetical protein Q8K91_10970, partial [Hylemonella sp.]|nr:hypothetical protein [Hylemonella sp.]
MPFPDQIINNIKVSEPKQPERNLKEPKSDQGQRKSDLEEIKKFNKEFKTFLTHVEKNILKINQCADEINQLQKKNNNKNIQILGIKSKISYINENTKDGKIVLPHRDGKNTHFLAYYSDEKFEEENLDNTLQHFKISNLIQSYNLEIENLESISQSIDKLKSEIS